MEVAPAYLFSGFQEATRCVCYAKKNSENWIIAGGCGGDISIWNIESMRARHYIKKAHSEAVLSLSVVCTDESNNGNQELESIFMSIISHGRDGKVILWDVTLDGIWKKKCVVSCLESNFCKGSFCRSKSLTEATSNQFAVIPVNHNDSPSLELFHITHSNIEHTAFLNFTIPHCGLTLHTVLQSSYNDLLVVSVHDGGIILLQKLLLSASNDAGKWQICKKVQTHKKQSNAMAVDVYDDKGYSGCAEGSLELWRIEEVDDSLKINEEKKVDIGVGISMVRVRGDGRLVAVGDFEGRVHLFGSKKLKYLVCISYHTDSLHDITFLPYNNHLCLSSQSPVISFWDLYS